MDVISLDINYFDHPKVQRLVGLLGRGSEMIPVKLWCHMAKRRVITGKLLNYSAQEIEAAGQWWGKTGEAEEALIKIGFLEKTEDGYIVHDWSEWQRYWLANQDRRYAQRRRGSSAGPPGDSASHSPSDPPSDSLSHDDIDMSFLSLWSLYPNKDGKKTAFKSFKASVRTHGDLGNIQKSLKNYLSSEKVKKGFIKNGSTWFNNWQDWIEFVETKPASKEVELQAELKRQEELRERTNALLKR